MDILAPPTGSFDYLAIFKTFPQLTPLGLLTMFILTFMRIAPIVSIAPFLGGKFPGPTKVGLALALTFLVLPHVVVATDTATITFNTDFLGYALKELLIGSILAFLASIPFYVAQSVGVIIDFQRGSSAMQVQDPVLQTQTSPIGTLYNYTLIVLFFQFGGPFYFLSSLLESFLVIPVDGFFNSSFFHIDTPFWKMLTELLQKFITLSVQLSAPALVAILMADLLLGIANRLAPQVQIAFLGMSIKSLLGLLLMWASWFFVLQQMVYRCREYLEDIGRVVSSF